MQLTSAITLYTIVNIHYLVRKDIIHCQKIYNLFVRIIRNRY